MTSGSIATAARITGLVIAGAGLAGWVLNATIPAEPASPDPAALEDLLAAITAWCMNALDHLSRWLAAGPG